MRSVKGKDTAPELAVRRYLHAAGIRFRLHVASLPGRPDIVAPRRRTVVFVHGCFWHGHDCVHGRVQAKTNTEFWAEKIAANRARDSRTSAALRALGWHVETIWECECCRADKLAALSRRLLRR
jgi:DNA mismatch endonuclease (patch repair protein)